MRAAGNCLIVTKRTLYRRCSAGRSGDKIEPVEKPGGVRTSMGTGVGISMGTGARTSMGTCVGISMETGLGTSIGIGAKSSTQKW